MLRVVSCRRQAPLSTGATPATAFNKHDSPAAPAHKQQPGGCRSCLHTSMYQSWFADCTVSCFVTAVHYALTWLYISATIAAAIRSSTSCISDALILLALHLLQAAAAAICSCGHPTSRQRTSSKQQLHPRGCTVRRSWRLAVMRTAAQDKLKRMQH